MTKTDSLEEQLAQALGAHRDGGGSTEFFVNHLLKMIERERQAAIEECINLSDEIELQEPDGGTKQWMAFKNFRNTMRDRLATPSGEEVTKTDE